MGWKADGVDGEGGEKVRQDNTGQGPSLSSVSNALDDDIEDTRDFRLELVVLRFLLNSLELQ